MTTYDLIPPRRPTSNDFGPDLSDDVAYPPNPATMPTAAAWNQIKDQLAAYALMSPIATFWVDYAAGAHTPTIRVARSVFATPPVFTLTYMSAGFVEITWPAGSMPPLSPAPRVTLTLSPPGQQYGASAYYLTNGLGVLTTLGGVATDLAFRVDVD